MTTFTRVRNLTISEISKKIIHVAGVSFQKSVAAISLRDEARTKEGRKYTGNSDRISDNRSGEIIFK
jgi:hypothetical protein